ncbi:DUF3427 domain-containing protein [Laceyella putida]|uniref:DUF3427 domain-containing protein n=1 Tax=Laceyella putida TaxID=110101 RepID=A0ABW2RJS9_9BACL
MIQLQRYQQYSRKEVHDIFDPYSPFTPSTGTWGMQGIVKIPNRLKDYVFFVTFGQKQGDHTFDESITEDGILTWQSQPKQGLHDQSIRDFISHDHLNHNIHLFLRTRKMDKTTNKSMPYTYLGRLAYLSHDPEREKPVYFKWQILDWEITPELAKEMNLEITKVVMDEQDYTYRQQLVQSEPPTNQSVKEHANHFSARLVNYAEENQKKRSIGLIGEQLVLEHEKRLLRDAGRHDLADKVRHVSVIEGDGAGYDILSFTHEGQEKYIEVKTTSGGKHTPFYMTINEVNFSKAYANQYYLYRVYNLRPDIKSPEFYIIRGDISLQKQLVATQFKVF